MVTTSQQTTTNPLASHRDLIHHRYGDAIGRRVEEVPTPALLLDIAAAQRNIDRMAAALQHAPAGIRPHVKAHKSMELARRQAAAGAVGFSTATVWEAVALAWEGLDDLFVVNTLSHPAKLRALAGLAGRRHVMVAVDDAANAADLDTAAGAAGSQLGVFIEVDTGMDRAGADTADEAVELARYVSRLPHLHLEGITGYEGHCTGEADEQRRNRMQRQAMDDFLDVAARIESAGFECPIRSAGGTATWNLTANRPGITEIQAGTYVFMDNMHAPMAPTFEHALTVATTVISRPPGRLITDAGNKSVVVHGGPTLIGVDLPAYRFDEEHGLFAADGPDVPAIGTWLRMIPGYAPGTVNLYDAYYVVDDERVLDVWPVFPRGPGHNGLLALPLVPPPALAQP